MRKMLFYAFVLVLLCPTLVRAEGERIAVIEDLAGVVSEVSQIIVSVYFHKDAKKFTFPQTQYSGNMKYIVLSSEVFDLAVPLDSIISIEAKEDGLMEMRYSWQGQEVVVQGKPVNQETLKAKSDFGDYEISLEKVKQLTYKQNPVLEEIQTTPKKNRAVVTFFNGTVLNVQGLLVYDEYYSTEGYLIGGSTVYGFKKAFGFMRGESAASVAFDTIQSIEFKNSDPIQVDVTLKNGKKASGSIGGSADLSGVSEKGFVCINVKNIKSIQFLDESNHEE